jgi:hypothetical protein
MVGRLSPEPDIPHAVWRISGLSGLPVCCRSLAGYLTGGRSMAGWVSGSYLVRMSLPVFVIRSRYSSP